MSEKRYFRVEYDEEWYLFDSATISEQLVEEQAEYGYGVFANSLSPSEVVDLLNEQQELIEELRLQEKEKGVPVFVVRDGKNPVALFFNEQRAMYYCQEHMANLTYQQEKWCRVE